MSARRAIVVFDGASSKSAGLTLVPGQNLRWGGSGFREVFGSSTSLEDDLLILSSAVYACDLAFKRGERENITRTIHLRVPVVNSQAFQRVRDDLEYLLYVLSHDNWTIEFTRRQGTPEAAATWLDNKGKTLLFSGGLDSLAAAVDLLDEHGPSHIQLASHVTGNRITRTTQETLLEYLNKQYKAEISRIALRTGGLKHKAFDFPSDRDREETQRTRSFMFLAIGALAARRSGQSEVVMIAENGQMAIHLPLSAARIGAFSTHTAHPAFVDLASKFFSTVLDHPISITNPFLYRTKAEVIKTLAASHSSAIGRSVSCWRSSRLTVMNHCGECVPCLVRRIAVERNGLKLLEYARDLLALNIGDLPEDDEGKRNLVEVIEFALNFRSMTVTDLQINYPDLFSPYFDMNAAVGMYKRFADEALGVFRQYPGVASLLPRAPGGLAKTALKAKDRKK
jgi:7-cyano-7-deazaguanine synthase in queuosine biosynthesis